MPPGAEDLVNDRFAEFQRLAREKGGLPDEQALAKTASKAKGPDPTMIGKGGKQGFMRDFFAQISEVDAVLTKGRTSVKRMGEVLEDALQATTQEKEKAVNEQLTDLVNSTNAHLKDAKQRLESLSEEVDAEQSRKKIRQNLHYAMAKKHQQLLLDFQSAQANFKEALERRQQREMQILLPDASEEEIGEMMAEGQNTSAIIAQKMAGTHALLIDEVQRIREKHQAILNLERSMTDLVQMFQEMAVLVDEQGEMLDAIEVHVHKAAEYTGKAEKVLIDTRKKQHKAQRCMCYLLIVMMILCVAILGPVLIAK